MIRKEKRDVKNSKKISRRQQKRVYQSDDGRAGKGTAWRGDKTVKDFILWLMIYLILFPVGLAFVIGIYTVPFFPVVVWCELRLAAWLKKEIARERKSQAVSKK